MSNQWTNIAKQIKSMHNAKDFLPLHEPTLLGNEKKYVSDCIDDGWVSSVGKYVDRFEQDLASYTGVKRAVAVMNGTAALHIALKLAGVQPDDEVLMPSLTFIATANAVSYCGAIPHFVDVDKRTLGMDSQKLELYLDDISCFEDGVCVNKNTGRPIRAVLPMHTFGHPVDLDGIMKICTSYNLKLVEDAAESLGSFYKGKHTGGIGLVSAVSFNGNKIMTTGGGGAILTNDEQLADYAKHLTTTAKIPHSWKYIHDEIGYNYRMPNLNAALGCAQLEQLDGFIVSKRELTRKYELLFEQYEGISLYTEQPDCKSNYWLQTLIIDEQKYDLENALETLNENDVMARPVWTPLHNLKPYQHCPKSGLEITEFLAERIINIPSSPYLGE